MSNTCYGKCWNQADCSECCDCGLNDNCKCSDLCAKYHTKFESE